MVGLVVKQVAIFLIYILIGISFNKAKLLPENSEAVISKLETNLILPIYIFSSLVSKISIKNIKEYSVTMLFGARGTNLILPVLVSGMPIGINVVVFLQGDEKNTYLGSQYCFISVIFCIITIPFLYFVMNKLGLC